MCIRGGRHAGGRDPIERLANVGRNPFEVPRIRRLVFHQIRMSHGIEQSRLRRLGNMVEVGLLKCEVITMVIKVPILG